MTGASGRLRVTRVSAYLDPQGRPPDELIHAWRDFGATVSASERAGVGVTVVQASWIEAVRVVEGVTCHFAHPSRTHALVSEARPDVIHWQGLLFPRQLRALARQVPGIPIVAQDHGSALPRRFWRRWLHRWGFAPLSGAMFTSAAQAVPFKQAGVLRADLPIYEVVEGSTRFTPGDQAAARATTGLSGDPCLLWVAHLDANKDPLTVLDAVSLAAGDLPGMRLWMCYRDESLLGQVRQRFGRDPVLSGRVSLVGAVELAMMEHHYRAADFLVQGSHKEGSGYGVFEALACGTTPLVTDIPSFRTLTGQGACGALVPPGDARALARAIVEWSRRPRAELRRRAREHFDRALSYEAVGRQLAAAYRAVSADS